MQVHSPKLLPWRDSFTQPSPSQTLPATPFWSSPAAIMGDGEAVAAEVGVVGSDLSCPCRPPILDGAAAGWRAVSDFMSSAVSRQSRSSRKSKTAALA
jgi:hypothetical protein